MKATIMYLNKEQNVMTETTQDMNVLADMVEILVHNDAKYIVDLNGASVNLDGSIDDSNYVRIPC